MKLTYIILMMTLSLMTGLAQTQQVRPRFVPSPTETQTQWDASVDSSNKPITVPLYENETITISISEGISTANLKWNDLPQPLSANINSNVFSKYGDILLSPTTLKIAGNFQGGGNKFSINITDGIFVVKNKEFLKISETKTLPSGKYRFFIDAYLINLKNEGAFNINIPQNNEGSPIITSKGIPKPFVNQSNLCVDIAGIVLPRIPILNLGEYAFCTALNLISRMFRKKFVYLPTNTQFKFSIRSFRVIKIGEVSTEDTSD